MVVIVLHLLLVPRSLANFQYGEERGRDIRYERSFYYQAHRLQRYYEPDALVQSFGITALRRQSKELAGLNFLPIRYEIDRSQLISRSKTMQPRIGRGWKVVEEGNERYISTREAVEGERNRRLTFRNVQVASNSFITIDVKYGKGTGHFARSDLALHTIVGLDFDKDNKIDRELMPYSIDAISSAKTESIYQVIPDTWTRLVYFLGDTEVSGIAIIIKEDLPGKDGWIAVKFPKVYGSRRLNDDELFSTAISGELK
jgi:hypothetical protein